jgi:hypothetical protein
MPQWVIAACQFLQAQFHEVRAIDTAPASDSTRLVRINTNISGKGCACQNLSRERFRGAVAATGSLWQVEQDLLLPIATEEMSA